VIHPGGRDVLRGRGRFIVVHAIAQLDEHRLVLVLHELLDDLVQVLDADVLCVAGLLRRDDAPAIRKQVRDDVRVLDARVFGLDVVELALVADVGVVPDQR